MCNLLPAHTLKYAPERILMYQYLRSSIILKLVPAASPYTIIPPGGIIICDLAGGNILKQPNVVDPKCMRWREIIIQVRGI